VIFFEAQRIKGQRSKVNDACAIADLHRSEFAHHIDHQARAPPVWASEDVHLIADTKNILRSIACLPVISYNIHGDHLSKLSLSPALEERGQFFLPQTKHARKIPWDEAWASGRGCADVHKQRRRAAGSNERRHI
jgi:hypothetical protein